MQSADCSVYIADMQVSTGRLHASTRNCAIYVWGGWTQEKKKREKKPVSHRDLQASGCMHPYWSVGLISLRCNAEASCIYHAGSLGGRSRRGGPVPTPPLMRNVFQPCPRTTTFHFPEGSTALFFSVIIQTAVLPVCKTKGGDGGGKEKRVALLIQPPPSSADQTRLGFPP